MKQCTDPVVGKILAGWRYDISGIASEMRGDYEAHLRECSFCHSRQRLHRFIDIALMALASVSMIVFLLAYGVIRHFEPNHAFLLEIGALGGFLLIGAKRLHDKLPEPIRERIPEDLRVKISGQ